MTVLDHAGYLVSEAATAEHAVGVARGARPDLIIAGIPMPAIDGYEVVEEPRNTPKRADVTVAGMLPSSFAQINEALRRYSVFRAIATGVAYKQVEFRRCCHVVCAMRMLWLRTESITAVACLSEKARAHV